MAELMLPRATDWIGAFEAGQAQGMTRRKRETDLKIGQGLMTGDYKGASAAAYGGGNLDAGLKIQGMQADAEKMARDRAAIERRKTLGAQYATDPNAARTGALGAGDFDLLGQFDKLDEASQKQAEHKFEIQARGAQWIIDQFPDDSQIEQRRAALIEALPALKAQGLDVDPSTMDLSNASLQRAISMATSVKDYAAQKRQERQDALAREKEANDERHARAMEGIAGRNASTSAYSAQTGRLSYEQRKKSGGFGTPGTGGGWEEF